MSRRWLRRRVRRKAYYEHLARVRALSGASLVPAVLRIYSGTQPASADDPVPLDNLLLAEVNVHDGMGSDVVQTTGIAKWFRVYNDMNHTICDDDVRSLQMGIPALVAGEDIELTEVRIGIARAP